MDFKRRALRDPFIIGGNPNDEHIYWGSIFIITEGKEVYV